MKIEFVEVRTPHTYYKIYVNGVSVAMCDANKRGFLTGEPTNFAALLESKSELINAGLSRLAFEDDFREDAGLPPRAWKIIDRVTTNPDMDQDGGDYSFFRTFHPCDGGYQVVYGTSSDLPFNQATGCFGDGNEDWDQDDLQVVTELPEDAFPIW